jgi:hypothetical protein
LKKPRSTKSGINIRLRLRITPIPTTTPPLKKIGRGMAKENSGKEIIHLRILMGKQSLFVPFMEILDILKAPADLKKEQ